MLRESNPNSSLLLVCKALHQEVLPLIPAFIDVKLKDAACLYTFIRYCLPRCGRRIRTITATESIHLTLKDRTNADLLADQFQNVRNNRLNTILQQSPYLRAYLGRWEVTVSRLADTAEDTTRYVVVIKAHTRFYQRSKRVIQWEMDRNLEPCIVFEELESQMR